MKYLGFLTCAVIAFICLNVFAGNHTNFVETVKASKKHLTHAESLAAELAELAQEPVRTTVEGRTDAARMGKDNSTIQTMHDAFGNKTESRVFYNDSFLKMVVLKTSANGQREALIYGQNGEVKVAPANALDKVLTSVAGEIARTVEIYEVRPENEMLAQTNDVPATPPTEIVPAVNPAQPVIAETASAKEPAAAETVIAPAPVETKNLAETKNGEAENSARQLRAAVQSLSAVRKTSVDSSKKDLLAKSH